MRYGCVGLFRLQLPTTSNFHLVNDGECRLYRADPAGRIELPQCQSYRPTILPDTFPKILSLRQVLAKAGAGGAFQEAMASAYDVT